MTAMGDFLDFYKKNNNINYSDSTYRTVAYRDLV